MIVLNHGEIKLILIIIHPESLDPFGPTFLFTTRWVQTIQVFFFKAAQDVISLHIPTYMLPRKKYTFAAIKMDYLI